MIYKSSVILSPNNLKHYYYQFVDALVDAQMDLGIESTIIHSTDEILNWPDIIIIVANPNYHGVISGLETFRQLDSKTAPRLIIFETEPLSDYMNLQLRYSKIE